MEITDRSLVVRRALPDDASTLCRWWNDGAVMAHAGFPNGIGTTVEQVMRQLAPEPGDRGETLIIEESDVPIGEMNYRNLGNQRAEIGIKICESSMQGKGMGARCLTMLISRLFQNGYRTIVLDTNLNNARAQHVYEKLGFQKLRVNENAWKDQLGVWQTSVDYELTPELFVPLPLHT